MLTSTTQPSTTPSTAVVRSTRSGFGLADPTDVEIPFSAGRTSWTGVSNGVSITVTVDKATPRAGEPVRFDVEASSANGACCDLAILFGDGSMFPWQRPSWTCPSGGPKGNGPVRLSATHTYNRDGRWMFNAQATTGNCRDGAETSGLFGTIEAGAGPSTGQGPAVPEVFLGRTSRPAGHENDLTWASIVARAGDHDGWIRSVSLDWGDGTPPQAFSGYMSWRPNLSGWPGETEKSLPTGAAIHHYAEPGPYTITLTAVSTGCDGTTTQQGTGSLTWEATPSG